MAKREIIILPDPILRQPSLPVERVDAEIGRLIDDMLETMYAAPGVGLAAVQIAVPRRVLVLDVAGDDEGKAPLAMINPEIVVRGTTLRSYEEGCLSIPDVRVDVERPSEIRVRYVDREGKSQEMTARDLTATVIQHEMDHLDGKLIIDFLSRLKRDMIVRRFRKQSKTDTA